MPSVLPTPVAFDPSAHLAYEKPSKTITMAELGFEGKGISPVAISAPFPLFSPAGVAELRREVFSEAVYDDWALSSHITFHQSREFPRTVCPFVCDAWNSPEVTRAVSEAAGIELVPIMQLELGTVNYQLPTGKDRDAFISTSAEALPQPLMTVEERAQAQAMADADNGEGSSTVKYHHDAYPFVCVTMLSDASDMVGGETAIRTADGSVIKARGCGAGEAVVLQGREINHAALKAFGKGERITMVTSYRAKDPMVKDASVLPTIRIISKKNRLNYQWTDYRFKLLSERFAIVAKQLEEKKASFGPDDDADGKGGSEVVNVEEMSKWIDEQIAYLQTTKKEYMTKDFYGEHD